ncbi:MAG: quinolinate synthase NadA [Candidatus Micrarchaeota archaeon]|nr:quinolinate synthase NadA [Candidatus Micrarchaeota archaeon]
MGIEDEIRKAKGRRNALILSHNYQRPEVQDIADYVGDSLELCREARKSGAGLVIFCGVTFMAEAALILTGKDVRMPDLHATCPMAAMLSAEDIRKYKRIHPGATTVIYINSTAEAKTEADVICTSANYEKVIGDAPTDTVLFGPDANMAQRAARICGKKVIAMPADGHCRIHSHLITKTKIGRLKELHPKALVLVHPECVAEVQAMADVVCGTGGMARIARESDRKEFIIGTEEEMCHRLRKENPGKAFYGVGAYCNNMKKTTLEGILRVLNSDNDGRISLDAEIIRKTKPALERMLA